MFLSKNHVQGAGQATSLVGQSNSVTESLPSPNMLLLDAVTVEAVEVVITELGVRPPVTHNVND